MPNTSNVNEIGILIPQIIKEQKKFFASQATKNIDFRITQLNKLYAAIEKNETAILNALKADLYKPNFEAYATEIGIVLAEIKHAIKNVNSWAKPKKVSTKLFHLKGSSHIYSDPYGVVLNIAPWNYPFQLAFSPLVGIMAAGNCCIIKPSELAPNTSKIIHQIISETFDSHYLAVIEGNVTVSEELLKHKFDYLIFTGGTEIGRIVYQAAAKHLTPVTLELGGKSPTIVDKDTDLIKTVKRIAWGKLINAGQTCIAPDYVFVHADIKDQFVEELKKTIVSFYTKNPLKSNDYGRIINEKHTQRLANLLQNTNIIFGGEIAINQKYIAPTLIDNPDDSLPIMQEEIFGPLLPIKTYTHINDVITYINERPKPLALYVFSNNAQLCEKVLQETSSGGGCVNDVAWHISIDTMPFGGVGDSGMGAYHGKFSFHTFSHQKSIFKRSFFIDLPLRYAPYKLGVKIIKNAMKKLL